MVSAHEFKIILYSLLFSPGAIAAFAMLRIRRLSRLIPVVAVRKSGEMKSQSGSTRRLQLAFGAAILIFLGVGAVSYLSLAVSEDSERWVQHTHEVLENLHELAFAMQRVEASCRGFLLTGDDSYLETCRASRLSVGQIEIIVRNLTVDNPRQQNQLLVLESFTAEKFALADMLVARRRAQGLEAAASALRNGSGQRIMTEFLGVISKMQDEELRLLSQRNADAKRKMGHTRMVLIVGIVVGMLITVGAAWSALRDSGARDLAQEALREGEERFRDMANNISQLAWMANEKGHIFWYNDRWFDYTGTTLAEVTGWGGQKLLHPDHQQRVMDKIIRCFEQGEVWEDTFPLRGQDGLYRWFLSRAVPIRDAEGKVLRWFGTNTDITDRKIADVEQQLLAERLSLATAVGKVGVWEWDLSSSMGIWDATLLEMYGFPPVATIPFGKWAAAVHPEDLAQAQAALQKVIDEKGQALLEFRITRNDGSLRNIAGACRAICDESGNVNRVIGVNIDVTEREMAEKVLAQSGQDQLRFKDEFLSHVSHEVRAPLSAMMQFTTIMLDGLAGEINPVQREYAQIVMKNARQLQSMIVDLLEVTRMENGKLSVEPETLSVHDAVSDVLNTLRGNAIARGVSLSSELPPGLPVAYADPTRLRQILIILVDNAIKFTPRSGTVKVQIRPWEKDPEFLCIDVSDSGSGIEPKKVERVFERLYQVSEEQEAKQKGLGLGLFICKELVSRQGGQIWVESELQKGSIFSFTVPVLLLKKFIVPMLKNDKWPNKSAALLTVEMRLQEPSPSKESQEKWSGEVRSLLQTCTLPNLDVLLPKTTYRVGEEQFFVLAFADEKGATVLAKRIREQIERFPHLNQACRTLTLSLTMLNSFSPDDSTSVNDVMTTLVANLESLIESQSMRKAHHA
jgi:PAS domain S-box-containing protein